MSGPGSIFVVVAAYNEAPVLRATLAPLLARGYSVVVVDDGSTDETGAVVSALPVHSLRHAVNLGQGAALQTGMTYALRQGADLVVHFDADGQHDARDIPALTDPIRRGKADVVLGSRFLPGAPAARVPPLKRLVLRGGVWVSWLFSGVRLRDTHNGLRAFSRRAAASIALRENGYAHATEILSQIRGHHWRYIEVPVTVRYPDYARAKGQSPLNALNITLDLMLRKLFP